MQKINLENKPYSREALIVLVRHAQSEGNTEGILSSSKETLPLTQKGVEQAKNIVKELNKLQVKKMFSSEILRARQTAEIISSGIGVSFKTDARLNERNFGTLEGLKTSSYMWRLARDSKAETYPELAERANSFIKDGHEGVIVAVSHGDTIRAPVLNLLNLDELSGFGMRNYNTNMTIFHVRDETVKLIAFGIPILMEEILYRIPEKFIWVE